MKVYGTICQTCEYCFQHYTFFENKLITVDCGHCVCQNNKKRRPKVNDFGDCEYYKAKKVFAQSYEKVGQALKDIKKRLDEVVAALNTYSGQK